MENKTINIIRPLFYFFIISVLTLYACNSQNHKFSEDDEISMVGKWHRFSKVNGYSEFDIDSQYVFFYNQKAGRFKLEYKIENDSFKYLTHKYAAKVTDYGDSIFFEGNDNTTATLYRFKEPNIPFKSIPDEEDSLAFELYAKGFNKRLLQAYEKAGFKFFDNIEEPDNPNIKEHEDSTFQKLLNKRKQ